MNSPTTQSSAPDATPRLTRVCHAAALAVAAWSVLALAGLVAAPAGSPPTHLMLGSVALWAAGGLVRWSRQQDDDPEPVLGDEGLGAMDRENLSYVDREILSRLDEQQEEDAIRAEEAKVWPMLEPASLEVHLAPSQPIEITFDDLSRTSPLLAKSIRAQMDTGRVPPRDPETIASRRRRDVYHVRADGPRYDLRMLRSV